MFFDSWYDLLRILVVGLVAYAGLVAMLRATGKRTLSKMNAFDFIVTVALGSTLASALLSSEVSLAEGLLAFALLCGLQYGVAFLSVRSAAFRRLIKAEPTLLFFRGRFVTAMMRHERVSEDEIYAALREQGIAELAEVSAVVLETNGSLSVIPASGRRADTLAHVQPAGVRVPGTAPGPREPGPG